jgi:hypothetical protein
MKMDTEANDERELSSYRRKEPVAATRGLRNPLLTDMLAGTHPFPADMEAMLRRIFAHDPALVDNLDHRYFSGWAAGQGLAEGRALLEAITSYVATQPTATPIR